MIKKNGFDIEKYNNKVCLSKKQMMTLLSSRKQLMVEFQFELINKRKPDLINPKRFSDKIAWYELFYGNKNFKNYVCKVEFKKFVKQTVGDGYTAKLYGAWKNVEDIDWNSLPKTFVLKSNCSSFGRNIRFIEDKEKVDFEELKEELKQWLDFRNTTVNSFGRAYYSVTPKIMAEELLGEIKEQPIDYKFFCFDGVPTYAYSAFEHFDNGVAQSSKIAFYDMSWNTLPVFYKKSPCAPVEKPKHFEEMKEIAAKLSKNIPFVRVDFYDTEEKPLVGEMTFYSGGFTNKFTPDAFDFEMGKHFVLPKKSKPYSRFRPDLYFQIYKNK